MARGAVAGLVEPDEEPEPESRAESVKTDES